MSTRAASVALVLLGACSIDQGPYEPTIDAGAGRVVVNPSPALLTEGNTTEIFVHVETPPVLPVNVGCASLDPSRLSVEDTTLVFSAPDLAQMIRLQALEDTDALDNQTMVSCGTVELDEGLANVVITDNDFLAIVPSPAGSPPVVVAEMQSTNVAVRLSAQPPTSIIVSVAHADTNITTAPSTLVFTPANYDAPQSVIVTGVHDANNVTDADTLTLSSTGLQTISVPFSVTDID